MESFIIDIEEVLVSLYLILGMWVKIDNLIYFVNVRSFLYLKLGSLI